MASDDPGFQDHFSCHAKGYAEFRPVYPRELVSWIVAQSERRDLAWDCGCGSGQMTLLLSEWFTRVIGTDASAEQIARAKRAPNVRYEVGRVEHSALPADSVDLVVSAQAAHWFDRDAWFTEIRRVARAGALVALITYPRSALGDPALDDLLREFYDVELAGYWPPERRHVDRGYGDLEFPFAEIAAPPFRIERTQTVADFLSYVDTWSAVRALERAGRRGVFEEFAQHLASLAGGERSMVAVRFPIAMRVGRVSPESEIRGT